MPTIKLILTVVSTVIGLLMLVASSLFINVWVDKFDKKVDTPAGEMDGNEICSQIYNAPGESQKLEPFRRFCNAVPGSKAAGALGIFGAVVQLAACAYLLFSHFKGGKGKFSSKIPAIISHGIILLIMIIAVIIGIYYYVPVNKALKALEELLGDEEILIEDKPKTWRIKYLFQNAMTGLDLIFCIIFIVASFFLKDT